MNTLRPAGQDQPPLVKYRGAVLIRAKQRKVKPCKLCAEPVNVGEEAWFPIVENIRGGLHRGIRFHARHFTDGEDIA